MPTAKLSSLFVSTATTTVKNRIPASPAPSIAAFNKGLDLCYVDPSSPPPPPSSGSKPACASPVVPDQVLSRRKEAASRSGEASQPSSSSGDAEHSAISISDQIRCILSSGHGDRRKAHPSFKGCTDGINRMEILDGSGSFNMCQTSTAHWKKEVNRERKQKFIFKNVASHRFTELMKKCANMVGTQPTLELFEKLGREVGVKEYNTLISIAVDEARKCNKYEDSLVHINKVYEFLLSMREKGFQIKAESYNSLLIYLIDMKLTQEFQRFSEFLKNENLKCLSRIGYYEMLLWIRVGNEDKIQELLDCVSAASTEDRLALAENYLLAFSESDRKKELLQLLEVFDIKKVSSPKCISSVFMFLGRLQMEGLAETLLLEFITEGAWLENISLFIYEYTTRVPKLAVEDIVTKFIRFHQKLGITPSIKSYEELLTFSFNLREFHAAFNMVDHMCKAGLNVPMEVLKILLQGCEQSGELEMVQRIYSLIRQYNIKPGEFVFENMISLCMKMKDFEHAYEMLADMVTVEKPTAGMFNAIMAGFFREKKKQRALMVLKQMEDADVKPNAGTFSYLIANCESEKDIEKYRDKMHHAGVNFTKYVYMALINAYAKFGNFEMAKQIVLDKQISVKELNQIRSVLVSALASKGQIQDALSVYAEIKQGGSILDPKAAIALIEHLQKEGELDRLLQILEELKNSSRWFDGCSRVVMYCVQFNLADTAIELLKQLKKTDASGAYLVFDQAFCHIWKTGSSNVKLGLQLLRAVKELELHPSRTSLDFLLSACAKAKDSQSAWCVWLEYETAGLPYNVLTFIRMYQALLASGEFQDAKDMLKRIPKEDPHARSIIEACKMQYRETSSRRKKKKEAQAKA